MNPRIIYKNDDGTIAVIVPSPEALLVHGIDAIAVKDVPEGKPYKIVDIDIEPLPDRSRREAWTISDIELTDGVGGPSNGF